ncbi:class I SAM-dependent DNA methyltransferase [Candidatus Dependentiae bacterium]
MNVFNQYAKCYDLLYQDKNYSLEVDYVDSLIKKNIKNCKTILNLGCGTGKHDIFLAQKGYEVTGVDFSDQMIDIAQNNLKNYDDLSKKILFLKDDVRNLNLNKNFDIVLSLFHVMSYQITNQDLLKSFAVASKHLKKDGIFIFDCWYGPAVLHNLPEKRTKKINDNNFELTRFAYPKMHLQENVVDVNYKINLKDRTNDSEFNFEEQHKMRYLFVPEVLKFLDDCCLELINYEEWLTSSIPNINSWSVCFICKKK